MMAVCLITVVVNHFMVKTSVLGVIKGESEVNYMMDFSKEAEKKGYDGDYGRMIVPKNLCVEAKDV